MALSKQQAQQALQTLTFRKVSLKRAAAEQRQQLVRDPRIPESGRAQILFEHARDTAAKIRAVEQQERAITAQYRAENVNATPLRRPETAAGASWLAAKTSAARDWAPHVFDAELAKLTEHVQRHPEDADAVALLDNLVGLADSKIVYSKAFTKNTPVQGRAIDARLALDNLPDVVASREAAEFADVLDGEITTTTKILLGDQPLETLEVHQRLGALPNLLPPSEDQ